METAQNVNETNAPVNAASSNGNAATVAVAQNSNETSSAVEHSESLLLPKPTGFVNDFANVIDATTKQQLEEKLNKLKQRAEVEFALATVKSTGSESIDDYSLALARGWGIGSRPRGDGLLLLLAVQDRKWRIQTSRELEAELPSDILSQLGGPMVESFRAQRYGEGLTKYVDAIIARLSKLRGFKLDD